MTTSRTLRLTSLILGIALLSGCANSRPSRVISTEPKLTLDTDGTTLPPSLADAPPSRSTRIADRHPLFSRPKEYYANTSGGKFGKTAAAAVVGVPVGIGAEIRQIVVGQAPTR